METNEKHQNWFNTSVEGLAQQGFKRAVMKHREWAGTETCLYRQKRTGRKCAIGHLIPDGLYKSSLEGYRVGSAPFIEIRKHLNIVAEDEDFLTNLQHVHDNNKKPTDMIRALSVFAIKYNLDPPSVLVAGGVL